MNKTLRALDRNGTELKPGDQVRFVMKGYFLPREQESFGKILEIDSMGGVRIQMSSVYRHFTSKGQMGDVSQFVYYVHHIYRSDLKARIYMGESGGHALYIERVEDELATKNEA